MAELNFRKRGTKWEYRFEGASMDGKRNQISKGGFLTKAECSVAGIKALNEYNNAGTTFNPSEVSLSDYLDYWLENHVRKNLDYNTYQDYESKVRIHLKPKIGMYRLCSIEPAAIQRWIDDIKEQGYAKSMVSNILSCLSGAMNYAILPCKYIKYNPCTAVKVPRMKVDKRAKEHNEYICIKKDYDQILQRFPVDSNFYLPIVVGYNLGTRIGETYGFDLLKDVNLKDHTMSINQQLKRENKIWYHRPPKYDSYRAVKIGNTIENILRKELINRKENMLKYGQHYMKSYVLPDNSIAQFRADIIMPYREIMPLSVKENGELLTYDSFKYCAKVIHYELGNVNFHSHALRHTHGTILAENGVNPKSIMERLGHKDIKITLQTYIFNTDKMQNDAVNIFEQATR